METGISNLEEADDVRKMLDRNQMVPTPAQDEAEVEPSSFGEYVYDNIKDKTKTDKSFGDLIQLEIIDDDNPSLNDTFEEARETCDQYISSFTSPFGEYRYVVVGSLGKNVDESFQSGGDLSETRLKTRDQIFAEMVESMSESGEAIDELIGQTERMLLSDMEPGLESMLDEFIDQLQADGELTAETWNARKRQSKEAEEADNKPREVLERPRRAYSYTEDTLTNPREKLDDAVHSPSAKAHIQQLIKHYEALSEHPKLEDYENKQVVPVDVYQFHQALDDSGVAQKTEPDSQSEETFERPRRMYSYVEEDLTDPREALLENVDVQKPLIKHYEVLSEQPKLEEYANKQIVQQDTAKLQDQPHTGKSNDENKDAGENLKTVTELKHQARKASERVEQTVLGLVKQSVSDINEPKMREPKLTGPNIASVHKTIP